MALEVKDLEVYSGVESKITVLGGIPVQGICQLLIKLRGIPRVYNLLVLLSWQTYTSALYIDTLNTTFMNDTSQNPSIWKRCTKINICIYWGKYLEALDFWGNMLSLFNKASHSWIITFLINFIAMTSVTAMWLRFPSFGNLFMVLEWKHYLCL